MMGSTSKTTPVLKEKMSGLIGPKVPGRDLWVFWGGDLVEIRKNLMMIQILKGNLVVQNVV